MFIAIIKYVMSHLATIIILLAIISNSGPLYADLPGESEVLSSDRNISETTNVHFTGKYCEACHYKEAIPGDRLYLKYKNNFSELCSCHNSQDGELLHPVDLYPTQDKTLRIPSALPLYEGKLTCITCHDINLQCEDNPELKIENEKFIRGAPYQSRTDLCFRCHDASLYNRYNPHQGQLDINGNMVKSQCLYCHIEKPDELIASFNEVKFQGDLLILCKRCHAMSVNHPANVNHIVMPTLAYIEKMRRTEKQFGIVLPLDYEGKIFCATCHNPHQKGVIPLAKLGARGASAEYKKRLQGNICLACHEK